MSKTNVRCAILISGSGTNMQNIVQCVQDKQIKGLEIAFVFSDKPDAQGLARAKRLHIPTITFSPKDYADKTAYEKALLKIFKNEKIDFIVLAGYMRLIGKTILKPYKNKILNIHPALLPAFPGTHGIQDAYNYGVHITGVTVHIVDEGMDTGPIVLQKAINVRARETLASLEKRIHALEYEMYPEAIRMMVRSFRV